MIGGAEGDLNEVNSLLDQALSSVSVKYSRVYLKNVERLKVKMVGGKEVNKYFKENEFERIKTFVQSQALIKWLKSKVPLAQENTTSKLQTNGGSTSSTNKDTLDQLPHPFSLSPSLNKTKFILSNLIYCFAGAISSPQRGTQCADLTKSLS